MPDVSSRPSLRRPYPSSSFWLRTGLPRLKAYISLGGRGDALMGVLGRQLAPGRDLGILGQVRGSESRPHVGQRQEDGEAPQRQYEVPLRRHPAVLFRRRPEDVVHLLVAEMAGIGRVQGAHLLLLLVQISLVGSVVHAGHLAQRSLFGAVHLGRRTC